MVRIIIKKNPSMSGYSEHTVNLNINLKVWEVQFLTEMSMKIYGVGKRRKKLSATKYHKRTTIKKKKPLGYFTSFVI